MKVLSIASALALTLVLVAAPTGAAEDVTIVPGCADPSHPGGDWRLYGNDLANTRTQPLETEIDAGNVDGLEVAWMVSTDDAGGLDDRSFGGALNATPVVAHGCVFVAASEGWLDAINADTGERVWSAELEISRPAFGGGVVGTPAVDDDYVYAIVNELGSPYVVALDVATGDRAWKTVIQDTDRAMTNASIVLYDGLILAGFSGADSPPPEPGGFSILDAETGDLLVRTFTIPEEDVEAGYGGASIWSTAAVDVDTGYAYVGTGNPHSLQQEHERTNSLIKIDLDRDRETFGEIVGSYRGDSDSYIDGLDRQPLCTEFGDDLVYPGFGFSAGCAQLDLDFGSSPNLFTDDRGNTLVGALQKSGRFHTVSADHMNRAWTTVIGAPCLACNASSAAHDGERLYVAAGPPAIMYGLDAIDGNYDWASPIATGVTHYNPVTYANGVVYTIDGSGYFNAFDAETGLPLVKHDMMLDTGGFMFAGSTSSGIAVARNTVYVVTTAGYVLAYRL